MEDEVVIFKVMERVGVKSKQNQNFVPTGFPSPAADYLEGPIDVEQYVRPNPTSTFLIRYKGKSMTNAGIFPGSLLVIDRSLPIENNNIVMAVVNGDLLVKHYVKDPEGIHLVPANKEYQPISITNEMDFSIWGVVTMIITKANDSCSRL